MQRKWATAYLFPDRLVLHSHLQTPYGSFASGPYRRLNWAAGDEEVGRAVVAALEASVVQRDMPKGDDWRKAFFGGLGVKSNAQLQRTALNVGISLGGDVLEFGPTHNGGTAGDRKGFQPIPGTPPIRASANAPPAHIGAALMQAFSLCTTVYRQSLGK